MYLEKRYLDLIEEMIKSAKENDFYKVKTLWEQDNNNVFSNFIRNYQNNLTYVPADRDEQMKLTKSLEDLKKVFYYLYENNIKFEENKEKIYSFVDKIYKLSEQEKFEKNVISIKVIENEIENEKGFTRLLEISYKDVYTKEEKSIKIHSSYALDDIELDKLNIYFSDNDKKFVKSINSYYNDLAQSTLFFERKNSNIYISDLREKTNTYKFKLSLQVYLSKEQEDTIRKMLVEEIIQTSKDVRKVVTTYLKKNDIEFNEKYISASMLYNPTKEKIMVQISKENKEPVFEKFNNVKEAQNRILFINQSFLESYKDLEKLDNKSKEIIHEKSWDN